MTHTSLATLGPISLARWPQKMRWLIDHQPYLRALSPIFACPLTPCWGPAQGCEQLLLCRIVTVPFHCVVAHLPLSITLRNIGLSECVRVSPDVPPISLHLLLPPSLHQTRDELLSDEYSDFPPIRVRKSSPEAPIRVPSRHRCYSSTVQKDPKGRCPPSQSKSPPPQLPRLPLTVRHANGIERFLDDYDNN
jgi:hypothetical protein